MPDDEVAQVLAEVATRPVPCFEPRQTMHKVWVDMAEQNARLAILARRNTLSRQSARLEALKTILSIDSEEGQEVQIESLTSATLKASRRSHPASCIRATACASLSTDVSIFKASNPGDDYAAIRQAVSRRYEKVASGEAVAPTLILIDGGKGQVSSAYWPGGDRIDPPANGRCGQG